MPLDHEIGGGSPEGGLPPSGLRSFRQLGDALVEDGSRPFERESARGLQEVGERLGRTEHALQDVQRRDQGIVEEEKMAGELAGDVADGT